MNYSENQTYGRKTIKNKKSEYYKRLCFSWGVFFLVGFMMGTMLCFGIHSLFDNSNEPNEVPTYGTIDGKVFNAELPLEWKGDLDFIPLDVPLDEELQEFIHYLCQGYNVDFPFVMALINQESSFRTNVTSSTGDHGLMQINEINHEWLTETLGVTDFNDPYQNTRCGIFILRKLFEKYEDPSKVLMAYNMGETGARRLWEKGIYETGYSNSIMKQAVEYKNEILEKEGKQ